MNLVGKVIGNRYEILEKIGEGGMATVYKARDNTLKRYVAVKVLRDEFITDDEFIKRFNSEAQAAASLTHPNIVSIYDVGHEETVHYIVMELVQGKTLKEIINEDGVLPWKWSVNIAIQVTSALETAHKNNIVHRDIKPHNIIITEDGIAKVTDFGIAKAVSNSTITAFGTTIGSVHYFSPEHARGGYTDAKSDIYSLGVVMYEMLTGRVPFDADTPVSIALKHMQEKPVEPIKLNPSIPYAINKIIIKAMEKDISLRYQNATELLKDLSLALKNPEGSFVKSNAENMQYTQRIPTIGEEVSMEDRNEPKKEEKKGKLGTYFAKHPTAKKVWIAVLILAILVIVPVAGFFGTQALLSSGQPKDVALPNFVGKTEEEAKALIGKEKLTIEVSESYDDEVEEGKIISQEPPFIEGYQVKENTVIKVVVSKGTKMVTMKKVVGMTYEEAEKIIKDELELEIEKVGETSKTVEEGVVIKQDIEEGLEIKAGSKVTVTVSKGTGIKQIAVPHVIGDLEADAKKKLKDLDVTVVYEEDTTKVDGKVLKQSLDAGTTVDEKTKITITVNKIEAIKTGTIKLNLKSVLGEKATIEKDEEGNELNPTINVRIEVDGDNIYRDTPRKDATSITATATGKGTVTVKVFADEVKVVEKQFDLTKENPVLTLD
ncbi:MAG: Stk1 family PASTA domain-containing Ser/Thr kinase [Clostridia bacterium]|nr:Stk1 family PASTA domain-containing Ser/Thr kinase [Clostridia bacterium]